MAEPPPRASARARISPSPRRFIRELGSRIDRAGLLPLCPNAAQRRHVAGRRLLSPQSVDTMRQNQLPRHLLPYRMPWPHVARYTQGCGFGFGVRVVLDVEQWGVPGSVGEFGWAGAANTYLWIDPAEEVVALLFTQAFPFMHTPLDTEFKRLVYEAMVR